MTIRKIILLVCGVLGAFGFLVGSIVLAALLWTYHVSRPHLQPIPPDSPKSVLVPEEPNEVVQPIPRPPQPITPKRVP